MGPGFRLGNEKPSAERTPPAAMGPCPRSCAFSRRNSAEGPETSRVPPLSCRVLLSLGWGPAGQEGVAPKERVASEVCKRRRRGRQEPALWHSRGSLPAPVHVLRGRGPANTPRTRHETTWALPSQTQCEDPPHTFPRVQMLSRPTNGAGEDIAVTRVSPAPRAECERMLVERPRGFAPHEGAV